MKFTAAERARIKAWLEKDPDGPDQGKTLKIERENGTSTSLTRGTIYVGNGDWKVRYAYTIEEEYPVAFSSPLPRNTDFKPKKGPSKWKKVPKFPPLEEQMKSKYEWSDTSLKVSDIPPVPKGWIDTAIKEHTKLIKQQMEQTNVMWAKLQDMKPDADGKVTFSVNKGKTKKGYLSEPSDHAG